MTKRNLARASALVLVVVALSSCSWRLEAPEPVWPSPEPTTQARDAAAQREHEIIEVTDVANAGGSPVGVVLNEIQREQAPARLDALGGLYEAYPDASPSPSGNPQGEPGLRDAVAAARDGHIADALVTDNADLALLLASAGLSHALSGWYATWVEDAIGVDNLPVVAERTLPSEVLDDHGLLPTSTSISTEMLAELAVVHDQARYAYEVMAARALEEERQQWLERRDIQAARGQALVDLTGVEDLREATYVVLGEQTADPAVRVATARQVESGIGARYASLLAITDAAQWGWLLHAAFDAYAQTAAYGEPTVADYPVPALPGVEAS